MVYIINRTATVVYRTFKYFGYFIFCAVYLSACNNEQQSKLDLNSDIKSNTTANSVDQMKFAVIDYQKIASKSLAIESINSQINDRKNAIQGIFDKIGEKLKKEDEEINNMRTVMSDSAYNERSNKFATKIVSIQNKAEEQKTAIDNALDSSMKLVSEKIAELVAKFAHDNNYLMALPKSHVIYADDSIEITSHILSMLNEEMTSVNVEYGIELPDVDSFLNEAKNSESDNKENNNNDAKSIKSLEDNGSVDNNVSDSSSSDDVYIMADK